MAISFDIDIEKKLAKFRANSFIYNQMSRSSATNGIGEELFDGDKFYSQLSLNGARIGFSVSYQPNQNISQLQLDGLIEVLESRVREDVPDKSLVAKEIALLLLSWEEQSVKEGRGKSDLTELSLETKQLISYFKTKKDKKEYTNNIIRAITMAAKAYYSTSPENIGNVKVRRGQKEIIKIVKKSLNDTPSVFSKILRVCGILILLLFGYIYFT